MQYFKKLKATGILLSLVLFAAGSQTALAVGTAADTNIVNTATVDYQISGIDQTTVTSNLDDFEVDDLVDLTVASSGGTPILPGSADQVLTFTVTNTGNATHGYALTATNGGGDFNMNNIDIWIESNGTVGLQTGGATPDTSYTVGDNAGDLDPNSVVPGADEMTVYVVADSPTVPLPANLETADIDLLATTLDAGAANIATGLTTALTDADPNTAGVDVVFGDGSGTVDDAVNPDGQHSAVGTYTVAVTPLTLVKSSTIVEDPFNGTTNPKAIPGATIRYTLVVTNPGAISATGVAVVDAPPANTTYVPESIELGGVGQTDADDAVGPPIVDNSDWNATNAGAVTVNVGTLAPAASATITFDVTIN